jgi:hypothetical protein
MQNIHRLAVFCGSAKGKDPAFISDCIELADFLHNHNIGLVYGGGNIGLMGVLADELLRLNGEVIGVIPRKLVEIEVAHNSVTKLHIVEGMHERKALMANLADAFLILPGGIGTMEEFFEIYTWLQLGYHNKPIAISNINGYYNPLIRLLNHMVDQQFVKYSHVDKLIVAHNSVEAINGLLSFTTFKPATGNLRET